MFSLAQTISKFIDHYLTARGDKESTLRWYRVRLRQFRLWLEERHRNTQPRDLEDEEGHGSIGPHDLEDEEMLTAYVASLYTRGLSVHTVNGHIRIIKAFYNYLGVRQHIQYSLSLHFKTS